MEVVTGASLSHPRAATPLLPVPLSHPFLFLLLFPLQPLSPSRSTPSPSPIYSFRSPSLELIPDRLPLVLTSHLYPLSPACSRFSSSHSHFHSAFQGPVFILSLSPPSLIPGPCS